MGKETCFTKKEIFITLISLSIPTVIEEVLATFLQYVDTAMVGHLGEEATAAVSVTTTVNWLVNSIPGAVGIAVLAMVSKAIGSRDKERVRKISKQVLLLVVGLGLLTGIPSVLLSSYIPVWMGAESVIQRQASVYFCIISLAMPFRVSGILFGACIRATKNTKTPMYINLGANVLNAVLNYLLIYVCGMGVTGAALATAVSYAVSGILMFWAFRRRKQLYWEWNSFRVERDVLKECIVIGLPVLGTSVASCMGYVVFASLVTGMGTVVFAAHSIAVTAETIFYISGYGLRTATSTMVGISLGENDWKKLETTGSLSVIMTVAMMCMSGLILYLVSYSLMALFTSSERVAVLGAEMLRLVAFSEPFFGIMIVMEGILYGLGRTKYVFLVETFSMWCVRILFTWICVRVWSLDLRAVWYCMIADNVCKAILLTIPGFFRKKEDYLEE